MKRITKKLTALIFTLYFTCCQSPTKKDHKHFDPTVSNITILDPLTKFDLDSCRVTIQFIATDTNSTGEIIDDVNFLWSSSDTKLATVDSNGLVSLLSEGDVTISVSANNITAQKSITIPENGNFHIWPLQNHSISRWKYYQYLQSEDDSIYHKCHKKIMFMRQRVSK